jgi:hypothetical protein
VTASSSVVISNLAYLLGAVVLAIIGGLLVWLRHRKPKSIDANVESFNRGLRALAPDNSPGRDARSAPSAGTRRVTAQPGVRVAPVRVNPEPVEALAEPPVDPEVNGETEPAPADSPAPDAVKIRPLEFAAPEPDGPAVTAGGTADHTDLRNSVQEHDDRAEAGEATADRAGAETG